MRGRKPKPTRLKLIEGNPGKRPINGREPKPPGSLPSCPAHLSATAKTEWKRLARSLNRIGMLTEIDRAAMAAYCQAYGGPSAIRRGSSAAPGECGLSSQPTIWRRGG